MKYLKKFEKSDNIDKKLIDAVIDNDLEKVKKYISMGANLNIKKDHYTAPMWCVIDFGKIPRFFAISERENWVETQKLILTELINANPDLYIKSGGMTFWDLLNQDAYDFVKEKFPDKFEEFIMKKTATKYNL